MRREFGSGSNLRRPASGSFLHHLGVERWWRVAMRPRTPAALPAAIRQYLLQPWLNGTTKFEKEIPRKFAPLAALRSGPQVLCNIPVATRDSSPNLRFELDHARIAARITCGNRDI